MTRGLSQYTLVRKIKERIDSQPAKAGDDLKPKRVDPACFFLAFELCINIKIYSKLDGGCILPIIINIPCSFTLSN
jgi:hypothetical protein